MKKSYNIEFILNSKIFTFAFPNFSKSLMKLKMIFKKIYKTIL